MPSICFQDNYITIDMDNDVKYIDIGDGYLRLNKSTTKEPWSFCSSMITVYYKDDTGHPERKFPAKDGANFPAGETITITGRFPDSYFDALCFS